MMRRVLVLAALAACIGCGKKNTAPTDEEVVAKLAPVLKRHPEAKVVFKALEEADHEALEAKPLKDTKPLKKKLEVGGTVDQRKLEEHGIVLGSPGFVVGTPSDSEQKLSFAPLLPNIVKCRELFATGRWGTDSYVQPPEVENNLQELEKVSYAIFIRVRDYTAPHAAFNEFTPGEAKGDVLVYSVPEVKRVGAYRFDFVQSLAEKTVKKSNANAELETAFKGELVKHVIDMVAVAE